MCWVGADCAVILQDKSVSRHHATLTVSAQTSIAPGAAYADFSIVDVGSKFKTMLGDTALEPNAPAHLHDRSVIKFGTNPGVFMRSSCVCIF